MDGWMEILFQISNNRLITLDCVHIYVLAKALFFTATYSIYSFLTTEQHVNQQFGRQGRRSAITYYS